jgi:hypothetical protein
MIQEYENISLYLRDFMDLSLECYRKILLGFSGMAFLKVFSLPTLDRHVQGFLTMCWGHVPREGD